MKRSDIAVVSVSEVWDLRHTLLEGLARSELEIFQCLTVDKRKRDWLAGRIAAKRAVQKKLGLPFARTEIRVEESGQPRIAGSDLFLSITHSGDLAGAIASECPIGFDLELIEPRDRSFEELVLTGADRIELDGLAGPSRDERLTLLWCEKEAYAKLEGSGLRIPFAELIVPDHVTVERGTIAMGGVPYAFAIVLASSANG